MSENINNGKGNRYWTVEEIRTYVINELQKRFPDSIIEREFCDIDIMVHGPNIPVEIQRIYLDRYGYVKLSEFEDNIRRQIEQNIEIFEKCWFFLDVKLMNYLQNNLTRYSSINMDWLYQFFKSGKLKIFTIAINGDIKELESNDFEFIKNFSSTCKLSKYEVHRILERNKSKIAYNIYNGHGFATDEINNWYEEYEKNTEGLKFVQWLRKRGGRMKELSNIKSALANVSVVNEMLKCESISHHSVAFAHYLGILEGIDGREKNARVICSDYYNILQYFPWYFEKKELWDYWRIQSVDSITFNKVVRGEYPNYLEDYKNQKNIEDAWY